MYQPWVGKWGTPAAGMAWIGTALAAGHLGAHGSPIAALAVLAGAAIVIAISSRWLARTGVLRGQTPGVNLEATRGAPTLWLAAHLDSKSQPVSILVRAAAIVGCAAAWAAMVAAAATTMPAGVWLPLTLVGVLCGIPVALSTVGAKSPGALDNATGVATVLLAAERIPRSLPLGVLLTSAEELGLAGAPSWVRDQSTTGAVINCDTIDDHGYLTIMHSHGRPERLIRAFEQRAVRPRRVLPGILVDSVAFAEAGWDAVTLSRGTLGTLARIHRRADAPDAVTGTGVAEAASVVAQVVEQLLHV